MTLTAEEEEEQFPGNAKDATEDTHVQWNHPTLVGGGLWHFFLKQIALKLAFISPLLLFFFPDISVVWEQLAECRCPLSSPPFSPFSYLCTRVM